MLSGIGPESELKRQGIQQVLELPVGKNLQDHCQVPVAAVLGKPVDRARKLGCNSIDMKGMSLKPIPNHVRRFETCLLAPQY